MPRVLPIVLFALLCFVLSPAVTSPAHSESHIRGRITSEAGSPIAGATVTALHGWIESPPIPPSFGRESEAITGPDGRYDLELDYPGCYLVRAMASGHQARFYPDVTNPLEATCVEAGEAPVEGIDLELPLAGAIAGRITDERTGEPLAGVLVAAWPAFADTAGEGEIPPPGEVPPGEPEQGGGGNPDGTWGDGTAITDSTGSYLIDGLASGEYLVYAEGEGHIAEFYPDTQNPEDATRITVATGETVSGIDLALGRGGCIHGRVTDERTGAPIAGAFVSVGGMWIPPLPPPGEWPPDGGVVYPEPSGGATTDVDGGYHLCGLAPGEYSVFAAAQGYLGEFFDGTFCPDQAQLVLVAADGDVLGIDFALGEGGRIAGRIFDGAAPVPGALVRTWIAEANGDSTVIPPWPGRSGEGGEGDPWNCAGGWGAEAVADPAGNYVLSGLSSGRYLVLAEAPESQDLLPTFYGGGQDPLTATPIEVTAPGTVTGIDIILERGGAIAGVVRDAETGGPLADVTVEIYLPIDGGPGPRWYLAATTDAAGNYRITRVPAGEHRVLAAAWDRGYELEFYREATTPEGATPVTVVPPAEISGIDFTLVRSQPAEGGIGGRVAEEDGQPIAGAVVTAISLAGNQGIGVADSAGFYWISSLPADEYVVLAAASGHVGLFYQQALSWEDATPVRVDGQVFGIDFVLPVSGNGRGVIRGRVTNAAGSGIAQAGVYAELESETAPRGFALSASDGQFAIAGLSPGRYRVRATRPGMGDAYALDQPDGPAAWITVDGQPVTGVVVVIGTRAPAPAALQAEPSVPNPFHDTVAIRLLTDRARIPIAIDLYAVSGRHVRRLELVPEAPGRQAILWNGRDASGALLPSGIYVYRASLAGKTVSGRLVLLR